MDTHMFALLDLLLVKWRSPYRNRVVTSQNHSVWMVSLPILLRLLNWIVSNVATLRSICSFKHFWWGVTWVEMLRLIVLSLDTCWTDESYIWVTRHRRMLVKNVVRHLINVYLTQFVSRRQSLRIIIRQSPIEYLIPRLPIPRHKNGLYRIHLLLLPVNDLCKLIHHYSYIKDFRLYKPIAQLNFPLDMRL